MLQEWPCFFMARRFNYAFKMHSGESKTNMQFVWLCIISIEPFAESFDNTYRRQAKRGESHRRKAIHAFYVIVCITWSIITHVAWLHVETGSLLNVFFVLSQNTLRNHISTTPITVNMCWRGFSGWDLLLGLYLLAYISVEPSNGVKRSVLQRATI